MVVTHICVWEDPVLHHERRSQVRTIYFLHVTFAHNIYCLRSVKVRGQSS